MIQWPRGCTSRTLYVTHACLWREEIRAIIPTATKSTQVKWQQDLPQKKEQGKTKTVNVYYRYLKNILYLPFLFFRPLSQTLWTKQRGRILQIQYLHNQLVHCVWFSSALISAMTQIEGQRMVVDTMIDHNAVSLMAGCVSLV